MYKLLAFDLDGTLMRHDLIIPQSAVKAIKKAQKNGIICIIATGRVYSSAKIFAQKLGIKGPIITLQGALIKEVRSGKEIFYKSISKSTALKIIDLIRKLKLQALMNIKGRVLVESKTPELEIYKNITLSNIEFVDDFKKHLKEPPTKFMIMSYDQGLIDKTEKRFHKELGKKINLFKSLPRFLEIVDIKADKGAALALLCKRLGVKKEEVIAVGDNHNDISMIKWAGLGVAVSDAPVEVKKHADFITAKVENSGIAKVVEKFLL